MSKKIYWVGFKRNKPIPILWRNKKLAKIVFEDVRPVEIREIKKRKSKCPKTK